MNDQERYSRALGALALSTVSDLTAQKIKTYMESLNCYTVDQVERAAKALAVQPDRIHFPTVGEFCAVIEGTAKTQAEIKWQNLHIAIGKIDYKTCERIGRDNPPTVEGPTAFALRSIGGFAVICNSSDDYEKRKWIRKDFIEAFEAYEYNVITNKVTPITHKTRSRLDLDAVSKSISFDSDSAG